MKPTLTALLAWMAFNTTPVCGQGYLLYDQASPRLDWPLRDGAEWRIPDPDFGAGQSFTPSMSRIDFIELWTGDYDPGNGRGARVYVILRSDSIKGPIIASTTPVFLEDAFAYGPAVDNNVKFFFPNPVPVIPGTTYYFQPALEVNSDDWWVLGYNSYQYPGGMAYWGGKPDPGLDMWFRTGIVIPEPSSLALGLFGLVVVAWAKMARADRRRPVESVVRKLHQ